MRIRGSLFWGLVLIVIAALLFLKQLDIIQGDIFGYFWPLIFILFGVWLIASFFNRGKTALEGSRQVIRLENARSARLKLDHGAGRLTLHSGASPENLLEGVFGNEVALSTHREGDHLEARIRNSPHFWMWAPGDSLDWDLVLNRDISLDIKIDSGASSATIDLSDLKVNDLKIDTGASTTDLTLPAHAGSTSVDIDTGASTLRLNIPSGVAARMRVKSAIASLNIDTSRFPRIGEDLYQSADFNTASNRVEIKIDAGVGSIAIK